MFRARPGRCCLGLGPLRGGSLEDYSQTIDAGPEDVSGMARRKMFAPSQIRRGANSREVGLCRPRLGYVAEPANRCGMAPRGPGYVALAEMFREVLPHFRLHWTTDNVRSGPNKNTTDKRISM